MNIFFLAFNPQKAAEYHCDKHVVKMILETAQLLYTAHWVEARMDLPQNAYKKTHMNHPCAIWTRESRSNYVWLCQLGMALCYEYTLRYGKVHKTQGHIVWLTANVPSIPDVGVSEIRLAMPDEYKLPHPVKAYQKYYLENKHKIRGIVKYTCRSLPDFLT
jgi:hypothetical protein